MISMIKAKVDRKGLERYDIRVNTELEQAMMQQILRWNLQLLYQKNKIKNNDD